ncbi:MAG: hypothetical protein J6A61_04685 [Clostridia bacterium]|nr:hypothetical protein [Clostridia bacterium]
MKRKTVICILVFLLVLAVFSGVAIWQWNNITAIRYAVTYTPEKRQEMIEETKRVMKQISEEYSDVDFSKLPDEGVAMLSKGELSEEVAVAVLSGEITWEEAKKQPMTLPQSSQITSEQKSRVDEIIAKIYVLRSGYTGKIDSLVGQALSDYRAKKGTKRELMNKYISMGYALQGECDSQMESLLSELSAELKRTGGDMTLISQIRSAYQTEKSLKKAEIIGKYQK